MTDYIEELKDNGCFCSNNFMSVIAGYWLRGSDKKQQQRFKFQGFLGTKWIRNDAQGANKRNYAYVNKILEEQA
ncbi:Undefined function [Listeria monocytogenes N53-1]|nr:Undefined function [Listeria monocytogenes N53-1]